MSERIDHAAAGIEAIDKGLAEAAAITIEDSLGHAVKNGLMDAEEALACLTAYERTLGKATLAVMPETGDAA